MTAAVERLAEIKEAHDVTCIYCRSGLWPCSLAFTVAAVEKVLELHRPDPEQPDYCGRCLRYDLSDQPEPYPCPTVRAVEEALG